MPATLLSLPDEIIEQILGELDYEELDSKDAAFC